MNNEPCNGGELETMANNLRKICNHFGVDRQIKEKLPEELYELSIECQKDGNDELKIDEIADVKVLLNQIIDAKGWEDRVNERMEFKVNRTLERIAEGFYD